jgi:hypothetical protein
MSSAGGPNGHFLFLNRRLFRKMDYKEPKTRTESKKQGKKDKGPYSAKHIRATETLAATKKVPGPAHVEGKCRKK